MPSIALVALRMLIRELQENCGQDGKSWVQTATSGDVEDWALGQASALLSENALELPVKAG